MCFACNPNQNKNHCISETMRIDAIWLHVRKKLNKIIRINALNSIYYFCVVSLKISTEIEFIVTAAECVATILQSLRLWYSQIIRRRLLLLCAMHFVENRSLISCIQLIRLNKWEIVHDERENSLLSIVFVWLFRKFFENCKE